MKSDKKLLASIDALTQTLKRRNSYGYKIISWLLTWAATAIGATVIAWVVLYILSSLINTIDLHDYPAIQNIIEHANLGDDASDS